MATSTTTTKARGENQNLSRSKSLTTQKETRPKPEPSGSSQKLAPNYLKPTKSSLPDPVKNLKKTNNILDENQRLLRRRSFDKPPSSLTCASNSTASPRAKKSLNLSPGRPQDRPSIPRKEAAATFRSSSFHAVRSGSCALKPNPRAPTGKSAVASGSRASNVPKKSGLSNISNGKKEPAPAAALKKVPDVNAVETEKEAAGIEGNQESPSSVYEVEPEIVKVATIEIQASDEAPPSEDKEVQVEAAQPEAEKVNKDTDQTDTCPVSYMPVLSKEEKVIKEDPMSDAEEKTEDKIEEKSNNLAQKAIANDKSSENYEGKAEGEDHKEAAESMTNTSPTDLKAATKIEDSEENEKAADEGKEKDAGIEEVYKPKAAESPEVAKRQVAQGKESPAAYNDVIEETRRKLLEERKNKVKALVGAFETVIDYESASSK